MIEFLRMLKEVENLADKCKCNKCVDQHKEEKNQKEKPLALCFRQIVKITTVVIHLI